MEQQPNIFGDILRERSPELVIELWGREFVFTRENTILYEFVRHPEMNHIYFVDTADGEERPALLFGLQKLQDELASYHMKRIIEYEPTQHDVENYLQYQDDLLADEAERFSKYGTME